MTFLKFILLWTTASFALALIVGPWLGSRSESLIGPPDTLIPHDQFPSHSQLEQRRLR